MNFAIIGTGYVGLVTGSCFAETGNDVICVDVDSKRIESLTSGKIPFYEPGLEEIVKRNVKEGRLVFTNNIKEAVENSLIIFICVGTPSLRSGEANLSYVFKSAEEIGKAMDGYKVVIAKSTAPVGTTEKIREIINKWTVCSFDIVSNPEFLKEGTAVEDFMKPDRVIIGANDDKVAGIIKEIYSPFVRTGKPILIMDIKSAEMTKYAANALLATKISFMNEMANLCELVGADIDKVRRGIGSDPRIGPYFLFPGVGFGGSCFPKDIKAIINTAQKKGYDLEIMNAVKSVNDKQREILLKKIYNFFSGKLKDKQVAIWGLSFKPKTNDIRDAPSVY
ncbi:MAG: UDP-glucose/GDP-mannose dehydrogenase family protein, partial [Thermodesulfobacteriota bacterium]|nr:UDP-glucose/GDP-mannose dehydrogenase family protein [Thermodesulfobacteriota bacterium]